MRSNKLDETLGTTGRTFFFLKVARNGSVFTAGSRILASFRVIGSDGYMKNISEQWLWFVVMKQDHVAPGPFVVPCCTWPSCLAIFPPNGIILPPRCRVPTRVWAWQARASLPRLPTRVFCFAASPGPQRDPCLSLTLSLNLHIPLPELLASLMAT